MEKFAKIWNRAAKRKGGDEALEELLPTVKSARSLSRIADHRWLAQMSKCVFSAGFVWAVVDKKWPGFEEVFEDFDPAKLACWPDSKLAKAAQDERIIRNRTKVWTIRDNARWVVDVAAEHKSFARHIARWPEDDVVGLYEFLKKEGSRLGGASAGWFLRQMGKDAYIFSKDVVAALVHAGVVAKMPTSKRDRYAVQEAFNAWREESGRSNAAISRVLACSIDA